MLVLYIISISFASTDSERKRPAESTKHWPLAPRVDRPPVRVHSREPLWGWKDMTCNEQTCVVI